MTPQRLPPPRRSYQLPDLPVAAGPEPVATARQPVVAVPAAGEPPRPLSADELDRLRSHRGVVPLGVLRRLLATIDADREAAAEP